MWYLLILSLSLTLYVDSVSSATESSRHKRGDESEPWKKPVLPDTVEPIHYDVYIEPNCSGNTTYFTGNVTIDINVFNKTNTFIVHSKQLRVAIKSATVHDKDGKEKYVGHYFNNEENDYFVIQTEEYLDPGRAKLMYWFEGNMSLVTGSDFNRSGLYKIRFIKNDGQESWLILSDTEQSNARYIFPNFDEPRFKASFRIQIRHAPGLVTLSNMGLEAGYPKDFVNSTKISIFKSSPLMSSHQVSFAITDLHVQRYEAGETQKLGVWGRLDRLNNANYTFNVTSTIRNYLQTELDMPFAIDKLDMLAVPGDVLANHRNNWGLNIYPESKLLFNETEEGNSARYEALKLIAHSQAHYYFGNLVTCRYWRHVWLSEALASFYEVRAVTKVNPTFRHEEMFFGVEIEDVMFADATNSTEPSPNDADILEKSYRYKGAALIRMMENFLGADAFQSGIRQYLSDHANGTAVTDDLWAALKEEADEPLAMTKIMKNWVERSGFPLIEIELLHGNRINATQKQFLRDYPSTPSHKNTWDVPLTYRISGKTEHTFWINEAHVSAVFKIPELKSDDWIEFNVDRTGYYRVNYDEGLWDRIVKQLNKDSSVFTEISRAKLFSDAVALVNAEELGYGVFLNLTRYVSSERDFTPWFHISRGLLDINRINNLTLLRSYQNYVRKLTEAAMDKLQVEEKEDGATYSEKQLLPVIMYLSCSSGYVGCVKNAIGMFKAWIQNETKNVLPKNIRSVVYCIGLAYSDDELDWEKVYERFILTPASSRDERTALLDALCCSRDPATLENLLDLSLQRVAVNEDECIRIMQNVVKNPYSENCAWDWMRHKYERVHLDKFTETLLQHAVSGLNTQTQYDEVLYFMLGHINRPISEEVQNSVKKQIESNIRWMDRNLDVITTWFDANVDV